MFGRMLPKEDRESRSTREEDATYLRVEKNDAEQDLGEGVLLSRNIGNQPRSYAVFATSGKEFQAIFQDPTPREATGRKNKK